MSDKPTKAEAVTETTQEVERIRDIIFGTQMRDYDRQFQTLQRDLERLQQEIDRLNEQLADQDSDHGKKLQTLRREVRKADGDLREELRDTAQKLTADKVDRVALGQLFIELGTNLTAGGSLSELAQTLENITQD
jgi:predicted  nucleic acid-binding Zn-ribbon protein